MSRNCVLVLALMVLALAACSNERVLHLRGQDATEDVLRQAFRSSDLTEVCPHVVGKSAADALSWMGTQRDPAERVEQGGTKQPLIMDGAVARHGQIGEYGDKLRMAEILLQECGS